MLACCFFSSLATAGSVPPGLQHKALALPFSCPKDSPVHLYVAASSYLVVEAVSYLVPGRRLSLTRLPSSTPDTQEKMHEINNSRKFDPYRPPSGYHITVYHSFNDEVGCREAF